MEKLLIWNVKVYCPDHIFRYGAVLLVGGRIKEVYTDPARFSGGFPEYLEGSRLDGRGAYLLPGLIDLHFHGCVGEDLSDGDPAGLQRIAEYELSRGITGICPACMTLPAEELIRVLYTAAEYRAQRDRETEAGPAGELPGELSGNRRQPAADLIGIQMEGPFISPEKCGAQDASYMLPPDAGLAERFLEASGGLLKILGLAPEKRAAEDGTGTGNGTEEDIPSLPFIRALKDKVCLSLTHSSADYETARAAIRAGVRHATHLYNAMPPFHHREPGIIGAVFDEGVTAELICDGLHVHPAVVRSTFRNLTDRNIVLVSDSLRAAGMPDGTYLLGGQEVLVRGKRAVMKKDPEKLAGSVTDLYGCMVTAVREMGIPLASAVRCAAENPARVLGVLHDRGLVAPGMRADLLLADPEDLSLRQVLKDGAPV